VIKLNGVDLIFNFDKDNFDQVLKYSQNFCNKLFTSAINIIKPSTYCGHFIVLVGYDEQNSVIFYLNPATSKNLSFTSYGDLESARKCYGTDEDIVFVYV
jgi:hypothetical protein